MASKRDSRSATGSTFVYVIATRPDAAINCAHETRSTGRLESSRGHSFHPRRVQVVSEQHKLRCRCKFHLKGGPMAGVKILVLYPYPKDVDQFERLYTTEHAPMVTAKTFKGITKFVATKVNGSPDGSKAPYYR